MSAHPNVILLLTLTPDGLSRRTMANILVETGIEENQKIKIGKREYHHEIMEDSYLDDWQISGKEGDLIFFDLVTYGYGKKISWPVLETRKAALEEWAKGIYERHHCAYAISITANYW